MIGSLTPAEARAAPLIALPIDIAAARLDRSPSRVKQLFRGIADKLGAADTKGAIVLAVRAGIEIEILPARH